MFRDFLGKMECKTQCLFCNLNHFLATKIVLTQRVDDRASANHRSLTRLASTISIAKELIKLRNKTVFYIPFC